MRPFCQTARTDYAVAIIRHGFLDAESRRDLIELTHDGSAAHCLVWHANVSVLLDQDISCSGVAKVLFWDDDPNRTWHRLYEEDGFDRWATFGYDGSVCRMSDPQ